MRETEGAGVPAPVPDAQSAAPPKKGRQEAPKPARKRRPGAQPGNLNRKTHGADVGARLTRAKRAAAELRDRFRRRGEKEARAVLTAMGLQNTPLARLIARQVGRLEALAFRFEEWHARRGYFDKAGDLKPSVQREVGIVESLLGEARRLLEQIASDDGSMADLLRKGAADGSIEFKVKHCECEAGRARLLPDTNHLPPNSGVIPPPAVAVTGPAVERSSPPEAEPPRPVKSEPVSPPAPKPVPVAAPEPYNGDPYGRGWIPFGGSDE